MGTAFWLQFLASGVAVAALVGFVAWLGVPRDRAPLDAVRARELLLEEFPDTVLGPLWVAADSQSALALAGGEALIVYRAGDGCVIRSAPWSSIESAVVAQGRATIKLYDVAAPKVRFALADGASWPPSEFAE